MRLSSALHSFAVETLQNLGPLLYYIILLPLSWLPFWALYGFSNFLRFLLYRVIKFRVGVVSSNLQQSFPNKTTKELRQIEAAFYKHMCDLIVESIKFFSISKQEAATRMTFENTALFDDLNAKGKSVIIVGGHYANWELYALTVDEPIPHQVYALYTPLTQRYLNKKMKASRSRYGLQMIDIKESSKVFAESLKKNIGVIFGSDQSPRNPERAYWLTFLNQETGVQFGAEKFAVENNFAVVYGEMNKKKRGYYHTKYVLVTEDAASTPYGFVTQSHTKLLEQSILKEPAYWLWSHRRWKHKRPESAELHKSIV